eukprot:2599550-Rhodomonas_salina.1
MSDWADSDTAQWQCHWSILSVYCLSDTDTAFLLSIYHGSRFSISGPLGKTAELYTHAGLNQGDIC